MTPEEHRAFWRNVQFTVDKDVVRTDRSNQFFRGEDNPNVESMRYAPPPASVVPSRGEESPSPLHRLVCLSGSVTLPHGASSAIGRPSVWEVKERQQ